MVCPLAVAFGQVALDVAILVQRTSLVNEFLAVSALECLDDPAAAVGNPDYLLGKLQSASL